MFALRSGDSSDTRASLSISSSFSAHFLGSLIPSNFEASFLSASCFCSIRCFPPSLYSLYCLVLALPLRFVSSLLGLFVEIPQGIERADHRVLLVKERQEMLHISVTGRRRGVERRGRVLELIFPGHIGQSTS